MDMNDKTWRGVSKCCVRGRTAVTWRREGACPGGVILADFLEEAVAEMDGQDWDEEAETQFLFEQRLTFIENQEKTFVQVV